MREQALKLGDCAKVISGYAFKSKDFVDEGVPVLKIANIKHEHVVFEGVQYLPPDFLNIDEKFKVKFGDVMICLTGSHISQPNSVVGRVAMYRHERLALLNQRAGRIIVNDTKRLDKDFLYYFLRQEKVMHDLALNAGGAANQANISPKDVERIELPNIDIFSQKSISSTLKAYDDLIENNKRRIELLEESARLLYKEWFVRFRFPGHEHVKIKDGVPEGWSVNNLESFVNVKKGKNITKNTVEHGEVPVVAGGLKPAYYHNKANTKGPVITVSASGANAGYVSLYKEDVWASDCSYIENDGDISIPFYYLMLSERQPEILLMQKGAAQPHVYPKDLMRMTVQMPPKVLLEQFADLIAPSFSQSKVLEIQNIQLAKARDLLLPKLMNGDIVV